MKIVEVIDGLTVAITNEEADLLLQFDEQTPSVARKDLDERKQIMANNLVNKNVLKRIKENGRIVYKRKTR
jgi:pheromone shutdown protein TraB